MLRATLYFCAGLAIGLPASLHGQTATPESKPEATPAPDFSAAFARLRALGLPSVKDALPRAVQGGGYYGSRSPQPGISALRAFAWEKKNQNGGRSVVMFQCIEHAGRNSATGSGGGAAGSRSPEVVVVVDTDVRDVRQFAGQALDLMRSPPEVHRLVNGKQDLEVAGLLVEDIAKMASQAGTDEDPFSRYNVDRLLAPLGMSLFFACHLDERGHKEAANNLARAALTTPAGGEAVVNAAVTMLAEVAYAKALAAYLENREAAPFVASLQAIGTKFPRGYFNQQAVRLVLADAEQAAAAAARPLAMAEADAIAKSLRADPLGDEAKALVKVTRGMAGEGHSWQHSFREDEDPEAAAPPAPWTISPPPADSKDPLARLLAKGIDALPVLLVLAQDGSSTPNDFRDQGHSYSGYFSPHESAEEQAVKYYRQAMPRPMTVGEIAATFLQAAMTGGDEESYSDESPTPEEMAPMAQAWRAGLKATDIPSLADHYLEHGNFNQKQAAIAILLKAPEPGRIATIERRLLDWHPRAQARNPVSQYLRARGEAGAEFLTKYTAAIEAELTATDKDYFQEEWSEYSDDLKTSAKNIRTYLRQLAKINVKVDVPSALDALANSKAEHAYEDEEFGRLSAALAKLPPDERLRQMLDAAVRAPEAKGRRKILEAMPNVGRSIALDDGMKKAWSVLLADHREAYTEEMKRRSGDGEDGPSTLADFAAYNFVLTHDGMGMDKFVHLNLVLGSQATLKLMLDRATALLAGKPAPEFPDPGKVGEERKKEILAVLEKTPPAGVAAAIDALGPDEKLALLGSLQYDPPASVREAGYLLYEMKLVPALGKSLPEASQWKGKPLDKPMLDKLVAAMRAAPDNKASVFFHQDPLGRGLVASKMDLRGHPMFGTEGKAFKSIAVHIHLRGQNEPQTALILGDEDLAALDADAKAKLGEANAQFDAAFAKAFAPNAESAFEASLYLNPILPGDPEKEAVRRTAEQEAGEDEE